MSLVLTKGKLTNGSFSPTSSHWFFENPYWNNDGTSDFVIRVVNSGSKTEYIGGFVFTFQIADSKGRSFPDVNGHWHVASGYNCTMRISLEVFGRTYQGSTRIIKDPRLVFHYSSSPGQSYWTPRPGPRYRFAFDDIAPIPPGTTSYIRFKAQFAGGNGNTNCIQISSYDSIEILPNYTVTYRLNGGSYSGSTDDYVKTVPKGGTVDPPSSVTRSGYYFSGWLPDDTLWQDVQQDLIYDAQWSTSTTYYTFWRNHSVSDSVIVKSGTTTIGTEMGDVKPINPIRDGYTFLGWSDSSAGSVIPDTTQITDSVRNFYAIWSDISGTVTFYRNYDDSDTTVVATESGVTYIDSSLSDVKPTDPVRAGYRFVGWALSRSGSVVSDSTTLWNFEQHTARTEFYAIWSSAASIWIRENGIWVKRLNPKKYSSDVGSWTEVELKERVEGAWVDKS